MSFAPDATLVLLPGMACDAELWREQLAALPAITCPTLVICGDGDAVTPPECSREIAAAIAHARLEWIANCGHMPTMEKPAEVNALLLDWLG